LSSSTIQQLDDRALFVRAEKNVGVQEADVVIDVGAGDKTSPQGHLALEPKLAQHTFLRHNFDAAN
jgi:hypothetical protein